MRKFEFNDVQLVIRAQPGVEIFLIDGTMRKIASAVGQLQRNVSPGVYKVRFRMSNANHDEFVVVTGDTETVEIVAPTMQHRTAIPFKTEDSDESSISDIACQRSKVLDKSLGSQQSQLFVFVYDSSRLKQGRSKSRVSIADVEGRQIASLDEPVQFDAGKFVLTNIGVPGGIYRVRVRNEKVGHFEMFVSTVRGWQTQVFLKYAEFEVASEVHRCPSLNQAGILMTREGVGFDPQSEIARLTDIALHALVQKRTTLADAVLKEILHEKFEDPLLGVFGAHLLLMQHRPDRQLLDTVCDNLSRLMPNHPDVRVLSLRSGAGSKRVVEPILEPPMLRASWEILISETRRNASLVPAGCLAAQVAQNSIAGHPWLLHQFGDLAQVKETDKVSIAEAERITAQFLEMDTGELESVVEKIRESGVMFTGLEENVLNNVLFEPFTYRSLESGDESHLDLTRANFDIGSPSARQVISRIDAPSYAVAESVQSIASKLKVF